MAEESEFVAFEDEAASSEPVTDERWKVVIIDDDAAVHDGTRFALYDYTLGGRGLEIMSAFSAAEGREVLRANPDTAVVLLDVVMETEEAGLDLVHYIRNEIKNETVRIILRTGQPGQAPERRVIVDFDINDYKAKTELTADKLFTTLTAALRSYQQLQRMVQTRRGLEIIIEAASTLIDFRSMQRLAEGVLTQIASLLNVTCAGILVFREGASEEGGFSVLAGSGCYSRHADSKDTQALRPELRELVHEAFRRRGHEFQAHRSVLYMRTASGREIVALIEAGRNLSDTDRSLIEVFCSRLSVAFENVILYEQLQEANASLERRVIERTQELSAAYDRLAAQSERLRHVNAFKNEILGTVAHDLKNPLGVIMGRAEMLRGYLTKSPPPLDKAAAQVGRIYETAVRMTSMVDSLLTDAMADALDITLRQEPIDLTRLVHEVVEASRPLIEEKHHEVVVTAPAELIVEADYDRLREAVDNLMSNAIKYTQAQGRIALLVGQESDQALVMVRDNGLGLMPEDLSRLFGRFQRLSAKPTAGESSTGLGLSIAKRIVDLHGGDITAESEGPNKGSTFRIAIPVRRGL